jgi:hypothetical protein
MAKSDYEVITLDSRKSKLQVLAVIYAILAEL